MFKFFKHSGAAPIDAPESRPVPHTTPAPTVARPHADIQRELVRVVLKDTLRRHGIPFEWLSCEVFTIAHGPNAEELHIQLTLLQWHELFIRYAPALEHQLLRGLDRFEPAVDHSKHNISWRFSPECGCPFTVMPPPLVWSHDAPPEPVAEEPAPVLDRRHATRPPKSAIQTSKSQPTPPRRDEGDNGDYKRTELSPFR